MTTADKSNYLGASDALQSIVGDFSDPGGSNGFTALPPGFSIVDIEGAMSARRRARSTMKTPVMQSFATYVEAHGGELPTVFVDEASMSALAVLNLGTPEAPGHCDDTAQFVARVMSPYTALLALANGRAMEQQAVAEFMEDWLLHLSYTKSDNDRLDAKKAISAVRSFTIEKAQSVTNEVQNLGAKVGTMSSVSVKDSDQFPAFMHFKCAPYFGFPERIFKVRVSTLTGGSKLSLALRIVNQEKHQEEMAEDLVHMVTGALGTKANVLIGTHAAKTTKVV